MRHQPIVIFADDLCDRIISDPTDNQSPENYGVRLPRKGSKTKQVFKVCWPEHVSVPRFNSDASYIPVGRASGREGLRRIARRENAQPYGS